MAVAQTQKQDVSKPEEKKYYYRTTPRYTAWSEGKKIVIRAALPGVSKENIKMKALKDRFLLSATRDDILYSLDLSLNVEVIPSKTTSTYEEGLLRVEMVRYNPLDDAYNVPIE